MRTITTCNALMALVFGMNLTVRAEGQGSKAEIEKKLTSEYQLTKATDDKTDIVTAGSVIVLQKDKLVMVPTDATANQCPNSYKDGKINQNAGCKANETLKKIPLFGHTIPGQDKVPNTRTFVTGEKFWVTKIEVKDAGKDSGVVFEFFTDAIKDIRYKGTLTIAFKKGLPTPDDALKLVSEVLTVAPSEEAKEETKEKPGATAGTPGKQAVQQQPAAEAAPQPSAPAEAPPPAIEPPPPPPAEAPTVAVGQTPDEVVAALGQPTKKAKVGTKEIYYYKDLKVVFVGGKVKDVQ